MSQKRFAGRGVMDILEGCGGCYNGPKSPDGKRLGPLVGYAGKYLSEDGKQKQYVGDIYANFAKTDEHPEVLDFFAQELVSKVKVANPETNPLESIFCGMPIGGYSFAQALAFVCGCKVIKAEKKITALATATAREQSELVFARHSIEYGAYYNLVEDVCNNFSTTEKQIELIYSLGGMVNSIFCILNRSLDIDDAYHPKCLSSGASIPVFSLERKVIPEYKQDDPAVAEDIAKGNVVWKPKDDWPRLVAAMRQ